MQCSKAIERLSGCVDGALDEGTLELVEAHLRECACCTREFAVLRTLVASAAAVQPHEPPIDLKSRIMHAVRTEQARQECSAPAAGMLSAYADGELCASEERTVGAHAAGCEACTRELDALKSLIRATAKCGFIQPPPDLRARILAATCHKKTVRASFSQWLRGLAANRAAQWAAGAAVAGVIAVAVMLQLPNPARQAPRVTVASERPAAPTTSVSTAPVKQNPQVAAQPEPARTVTHRAVAESHARIARRVARASGAKPSAVKMAMRKAPSPPSVSPSTTETENNAEAANARQTAPAEVAVAPAPAPEIAPAPKKRDEPVLVRVAAAPAIKSEESEQWIKRAKAEVAMRRSAQGPAAIRLFETKF